MSPKAKLLQTGLSILVLLLVLVNIFIGIGNQSIQSEVSERQRFIAQTMRSTQPPVDQRARQFGAKTNDEPLMGVLARPASTCKRTPDNSQPSRRR
jgi:hypothetical protein